MKPTVRRLVRIATLAVIVATGLSEAAATPPAPIPDTPAGRRFADLMALTSAGDAAAIGAYVRENFTPSMQQALPGDPGIVAFIAEHAKGFGGFEVVRSLVAAPDQVVMLVRPKSQASRWLRYILKVEAAPPHLVEGLFLMPATPSDIPQGEGAALSPEEAVAAFTREVERAIADAGFSGVVLLARGDDVVLQRVAGEANREHHVAVNPETVFGLASVNKMFTAVAIGRLVEQGRIAWNDPVGKHLRGWLPENREQSITIHQLLTHTAGLGDYLSRVAEDPAIAGVRSLDAYRELVRTSPIEPPPEGQLSYSNTGYVVLGALIEAVTGRNYYDFVREEIYARAGMTRTDSWCGDEIIENRATGYISPERAEAAGLGRGWRSNGAVKGVRGTSAGGGWSTAGDLLRFSRALVAGRIVSRETLDALVTHRVRFPVGGDYGYGFVVHTGRDGKRIFGHSGGFLGASAEFKVYGDGAWTLIVLSNGNSGSGEIVGAWDSIAARLGQSARVSDRKPRPSKKAWTPAAGPCFRRGCSCPSGRPARGAHGCRCRRRIPGGGSSRGDPA